MAGFSKYPDHIDSSTELPVATDNVTPVKAEVVNRLRDAILAIESELGVQPSGTFGTVRSRLDALELGGGGGGAIDVSLNGTIVEPNTTGIDFAGDVNVEQTTPLHVKVTIGGNTTQKQESIAVSNGQTSINLGDTPVQANGVEMFLNGLKQTYGTEYTVSGSTVTWSGPPTLSSSDRVDFWYLVNPILGGGGGSGGSLEIQEDGVTIEDEAEIIDFESENFSITNPVDGTALVNLVKSKIRVYRDTSALVGSAVTVDKTVIWNATSTLLTSTNASLGGGGTQLTTTKAGTYDVSGNLTIEPTVDSISGLTIDVLHNGLTVVHTLSDYGAVWGVGLKRSFAFSFKMELAVSDTLEVRWRHSGGVSSTTQLDTGDSASWFSILKVN